MKTPGEGIPLFFGAGTWLLQGGERDARHSTGNHKRNKAVPAKDCVAHGLMDVIKTGLTRNAKGNSFL